MKVAFATKDGTMIDDHFGWAKRFSVYDISKDGSTFVKDIETPEDQDEEDDRIAYKIEAIQDCAIMYCENIGPTAAAKVTRARIHPIKVKEPKSIQDEIQAIVTMLQGNPPPWIKRIMAKEGDL